MTWEQEWEYMQQRDNQRFDDLRRRVDSMRGCGPGVDRDNRQKAAVKKLHRVPMIQEMVECKPEQWEVL